MIVVENTINAATKIFVLEWFQQVFEKGGVYAVTIQKWCKEDL